MKTVSTLCATSTVGVAACGLALGRPSFSSTSTGSRLDNNQFHSTTPSYSDSTYYCPSTVPSTPISEQPPTKSWYRRFSTSRSARSAPSPVSSPQRSRESVSLSWSPAARPQTQAILQPPRPPTGNRLVKKSLVRQLAPSPLALTSRPPTRRSITESSQRPATSAGRTAQPLGRVRRHTLTFSRPSTAVASSSRPQRFSLRVADTWSFLFRGKRPKSSPAIRRIYPEERYMPTLMQPQMISHDQADRESIYSVSPSVYLESRPTTPMPPLGGVVVEEQVGLPVPKAEGLKRSFSITNILTSASNRLPSRGSISRRRFSSSVMAEQSGSVRRPSTANYVVSPPFSPLSPHAPSSLRQPELLEPMPPSPPLAPRESMQSIDDIENDSPLPLSPPPRSSSGRATASPVPSLPISTGRMSKASSHPHRFSQASVAANSEHASTLIGSDAEESGAEDDAGSEVDFMSETVFDSMRTRNSETPIRADSIFENVSQVDLSPSSARLTVASKRELDRESERSSGQPSLLRVSTIWSTKDSDRQSRKSRKSRDSWDESDWDVHSSVKSVEENNKAGESLYPSSSLFSPMQNNGSHSSFASFGSALEDPWEEDNADVTIRPQTSHLNFTSQLKPRPTNMHVRSHSMPGKNTLGRAYVRALVSENWDDDFDESTGEEVIIPQAIEAAQASVVDHLSYVREFATLVEDLKRLRERAYTSNTRTGKSKALWDEADGIIALATLQSTDENTPPSISTNPSKISVSLEDTTNALSLLHLPDKSKKPRRKSILGDEEGIFGASGNLANTPPPLKVTRSSTSSTTSSPPRLSVRRTQTTPTITQTDAVETAKALIRKMKLAHGKGGMDVDLSGKIHFDTSMLGELVGRVVVLCGELEEALEREGRREENSRPAKEVFDVEGRSLGVGCAR